MPTIPELLNKLNNIYDKEEILIKEFNKFKLLYQQLKEEKELLQTMIMHESNKQERLKRLNKTYSN